MKNIIISKNNMHPNSFKGWGTSLCWWANRVGYSEKITKDSARLFFSADGLGLNIMRYNIGGGDDPTHNHITRTDSDMPGWLKKDEEGNLYYDYTADEYQLNVLKASYEAAGTDAYVEAFSNSPPYFMTVSGCSSGSKSAITNNLKKNCVADFAEYLAHVSSYINNEIGIKISSLAAMNEPYTNYWRANSPKQEGCHVSPGKMQSLLLCETKKAMEKAGLSQVEITASDETNTYLQHIACKKLSEEAWNVVDRVSTHTYAKATPKIKKLCEEKKKPLWMTETDWSNTAGENAGEMGAGLGLSKKIIEDLNTLTPEAWVIWQIMAGDISKYEYKGRRDPDHLPDLDKGYWGVAFPDMDTEEIFLTQKYFSFGQFSRYIRPGMRLIRVDKNSVAAYNEDEKKLVLVCVNDKAESQHFQVKADIFSCVKSIEAVRTSGNIKDGEKWKSFKEIAFFDNGFIAHLKANSITTYIINGCPKNEGE